MKISVLLPFLILIPSVTSAPHPHSLTHISLPGDTHHSLNQTFSPPNTTTPSHNNNGKLPPSALEAWSRTLDSFQSSSSNNEDSSVHEDGEEEVLKADKALDKRWKLADENMYSPSTRNAINHRTAFLDEFLVLGCFDQNFTRKALVHRDPAVGKCYGIDEESVSFAFRRGGFGILYLYNKHGCGTRGERVRVHDWEGCLDVMTNLPGLSITQGFRQVRSFRMM